MSSGSTETRNSSCRYDDYDAEGLVEELDRRPTAAMRLDKSACNDEFLRINHLAVEHTGASVQSDMAISISQDM